MEVCADTRGLCSIERRRTWRKGNEVIEPAPMHLLAAIKPTAHRVASDVERVQPQVTGNTGSVYAKKGRHMRTKRTNGRPTAVRTTKR